MIMEVRKMSVQRVEWTVAGRPGSDLELDGRWQDTEGRRMGRASENEGSRF